MRKESEFDRWSKLVAILTETELWQLRARVPKHDPHRQAKLRMIEKRIAMRHGFLGS